MKLSKLYCNRDNAFKPIRFADGLNVVLAEIRLPENRNRDTHNLGKTTLGRLIDFMFLASRNPDFFLFKHSEEFFDFVFFLEIEVENGSFVTIRRSASEASKISFKKHANRDANFVDLAKISWDHAAVPFERAKRLLDGLLDLRALKPWGFRNGLGYLLRSQEDYSDVFRLSKFGPKHSQWKPFVAQLLGFDAVLINEHYAKIADVDRLEAHAEALEREIGGAAEDLKKIEGLILLKQKDADARQEMLDNFDFSSEDADQTGRLVEEVDARLAELNNKRYYIKKKKKSITDSMAHANILFDPIEAQRIFGEAGVLFEGQVKKDFTQLIQFNREITEERRAYLQEEVLELDNNLSLINSEISELGAKRSQILRFLDDVDLFSKYKSFSNVLVELRTEISTLERQKSLLDRLQNLQLEIREAKEIRTRLQGRIEADVRAKNSDKSSLFSSVRFFFSDIIEEVIGRKALLSASINKLGHLDFAAEILDGVGTATSAASGHTYQKLLCVSFDLAMLRAHLDLPFARFVFHDGIFEALDDRKKEKLIEVVRSYSQFGLQPIVTLIDSDIPVTTTKNSFFNEDEIVSLLHDENEEGRLFKMPPW